MPQYMFRKEENKAAGGWTANLRSWDNGEVIATSFGDQYIVFNAHATEIFKSFEFVGNQKCTLFRIIQGFFE